MPVLIYSEHTYLFDLQLHDNHWEFGSELEEALSKKGEWNLAQVKIEVLLDTKSGTRTLGSKDLKMGIQVFKKGSSTEDIVFTNPYKKSKTDDDDDDGDEEEMRRRTRTGTGRTTTRTMRTILTAKTMMMMVMMKRRMRMRMRARARTRSRRRRSTTSSSNERCFYCQGLLLGCRDM